MANNGNLRPWPKGVSGNPSGRPTKKLITSELERLLEREAPRVNGKTYAVVIAEADYHAVTGRHGGTSSFRRVYV